MFVCVCVCVCASGLRSSVLFVAEPCASCGLVGHSLDAWALLRSEGDSRKMNACVFMRYLAARTQAFVCVCVHVCVCVSICMFVAG